MPDLSHLEALPELVQVWGGLWLFITAGVFWLVPKVLAIDNILETEAEKAAAAELWRINDYLRRKLFGSDVAGTDYLTSVTDIRELQSIVRACAAPITTFSACRRYIDWVRIALGFHAGAWAIWVALILFTEVNAKAAGAALFFPPLVVVFICGLKAAMFRNELHS